jgi:hypothetical protein
MKKTMFLAMALSLLAAPAFAKKSGAKNHHCMLKDGTEATAKTKKSCKKAGGKWMKNGPIPPGDTTGSATPPAEPPK